ncbi:MAG: MoaD/ThiS family protein [Candidatus Sumerlaeaceae bacterium]|nr:MoaD/ThiS family protein [Candidatus Sumerlaeaceae bacterium]
MPAILGDERDIPYRTTVPMITPPQTSLMKIRVRYYHKLRQVTGKNEDVLAFPAGERQQTISDLLAELTLRHPGLAELLPSLCFARNGEFAPVSEEIADGDTIDLMPPFCGG